MPTTREEEIALGLTSAPTGQAPLDPKTKIKQLSVDDRQLYRKRIDLKKEDLEKVKKTLKKACEEWEQNSSYLMSKLQRIEQLTSGIKRTKNFPWRNSSNIHIPLIEIHIGNLASSIESTILDIDPVFTVRTKLPELTPDDSVDPNIENFLSYKVKNELHLDRKISEAIRNSLKHPLGIGVEDWIEEYATRYDIRAFDNVDAFTEAYPSPDEAGVSTQKYQAIIKALLAGEPVHLRVQEEYVKYRGPDLRIVELKNLIVWPSTSPSFDYAQFVGDYVTHRAAYYRKGIKYDWFDKTETESMLKSSKSYGETDRVTQTQDRIEGINRSLDSEEPGCAQGNLKIDLDDDGEEEMYAVVYCPKTDNLLRFEMYPYWHNRMNYIPFRVERKTNRLLGVCVYDWLYDINEEVDTQHNQRIDSRTITTVPSFKRKSNATFDPTREDQKFYPGVTFKVTSMDEVQQFEIKQTDISTSMQEESWLFQIAEYRTGGSVMGSGSVAARDPRAPFKKVAALLQKASQRIDPYIRELKPSIVEIAQQTLELYYQFSPETIGYPQYDEETQRWLIAEIRRSQLRQRNMTIDIARSTIEDNPDAIAQRRLVEYNILKDNPIIGSNLRRLHSITRELVTALRKRHANDLVPPLAQFLQEMNAQNAIAGAQGSGQTQLQSLIQNLINAGRTNGNRPTGQRQGGPVVTPESATNSPSPGV